MKTENCKVGMKVRCINNELPYIEKGEEFKIEKVIESHKHIVFEEKEGLFSPYYFEKIEDKFKIGEKVKWEGANKEKYNAVIFGIADKEGDYGDKYAITTFLDDRRIINRTVKENDLYKIKKKDELEKVDKFIEKYGGLECKILSREYDEKRGNQIFL